MEVPIIISADAVLKPRTGGLSLLSSTEEMAYENQKRFRAEPAKVKQAVEELKKAGFSVVSVGKITIGIMAPGHLFEDFFQVKLIHTEQGVTLEGSPQFGLIEVTQGTLATLLEGIIINQPTAQFVGANPPPKDKICKLYPDEIPGELGLEGNLLQKIPKLLAKRNGKPVKVAFIDTGFVEHGYFTQVKNYVTNTRKVILVNDVVIKAYSIFQQERAKFEEFKKLVDAFVLKVVKTSPKPGPNDPIANILSVQQELIELKTFGGISEELKAEFSKIVTLLNLFTFQDSFPEKRKKYQVSDDDFKKSIKNKDDPKSGHGTRVLANFFPLASLIEDKSIEVTMIKLPSILSTSLAFDWILDGKKNFDIISVSIGTPDIWDDVRWPPVVRTYLQKIFQASQKSILLFAAGNNDKALAANKSIETQLNYILSVGGAYLNEEKKVTASDFAHGYKNNFGRTVPDICGLCGPEDPSNDSKDGGYIWMPYYDGQTDEWACSGGTSFSTPQLASLCTVMKKILPNITMDEIKENLKKTARPVTEGVFHMQNENDLQVGLANMRGAIVRTFTLKAKKAVAAAKK